MWLKKNRQKADGTVKAGKYQLLYQYLEKRFANTVVLTLTQIEDLLGFALPESAHVDQQWWANDADDGQRDAQSRSWTLASRTATPNLQAQTVAFERAQR
jgi:hypothetical protein